MGRFDELRENFRYVWHEEGALATAQRLRYHAGQAGHTALSRLRPAPEPAADSDMVDVMFINGCEYSVPQPIRYRVFHQAEQLEIAGFSTRVVNAWELTLAHARLAHLFIIFRCPYTELVGSFIELVHDLNRRVLFDIDDLVIDTCYTDQIPYLDTMDNDMRALYDEGVRRMGHTMSLCDGAITTTTELECQLSRYLDKVYINPNVASEEMLTLSERAVYERDVLPLVPREKVEAKDAHRYALARERRAARHGFTLGYFSGSITHNDDLVLIAPALRAFMEAHDEVRLVIAGEIDLPSDLRGLEGRVDHLPFMPWRRLPQAISFVDVNLIPLADTIFNRAKSENKWVEASLVKVPSLASRVGALAEAIEDGVDGVLVENSNDAWTQALEHLYEDAGYRHQLATQAYETCRDNHVTFGNSSVISEIVKENLTPSYAFVLAGLVLSGGVLVAERHAYLLHMKGFDVTIIGGAGELNTPWLEVRGSRLPVVSRDACPLRVAFDAMVATMWATEPYVRGYQKAIRHFYLVQNYEPGFYQAGDWERHGAFETYASSATTYLTISRWCQKWLRNRFNKEARYAPNGIDLSSFAPVARDWSGKIRILVEGDSESPHKNVDESFHIIERLDSERFEVWYLSYAGKPKDWYRVDRCFNRVDHAEVGSIYQQCHILLKTSVLESFSYPPLEMMSTGGAVVALKNGGNAEYLADGTNSLLFDEGQDDKAAQYIERLAEDEVLRETLREGGLATAGRLSWDVVEDQVIAMYDLER